MKLHVFVLLLAVVAQTHLVDAVPLGSRFGWRPKPGPSTAQRPIQEHPSPLSLSPERPATAPGGPSPGPASVHSTPHDSPEHMHMEAAAPGRSPPQTPTHPARRPATTNEKLAAGAGLVGVTALVTMPVWLPAAKGSEHRNNNATQTRP